MNTEAITIKLEEVRKRVFWTLMAAVFGLLLFYGYFTVSAIIDVAERRRLGNEVLDLRTDAVALELQFMEKEGSITLEYARTLGYVETSRQFASRELPVAAVSLNNEN